VSASRSEAIWHDDGGSVGESVCSAGFASSYRQHNRKALEPTREDAPIAQE
jgi:hypothetical protein